MKLNHEIIEKNTGLLLILIVVSISFATLVEIVPLIYTKEVNQPLPNMKPWTALEMEGRDIYIREGCHVCHTQMVRPLRAEVERYGPYSRAAESAWITPSYGVPSVLDLILRGLVDVILMTGNANI